ncbi:MAG: subclass B3 metallo-beta-lactamase [Sphingomonadaceae bacterium]|nr:subclass B3 metallo-beta-lactamase [Sphingomonadaceae bacterium]
MFARLKIGLTLLAATTSLSAAPVPEETAAPAADQAAWAAACEDWDEWDKPAPPYRIHGNTYYVGTCGIAAILVVGEYGLVLFDSGTEPGSKVVTANIEALGYSIKDVKALFASHEHFDHVGGMARLQELSGATVYAGWGASAVIRSGKDDPRDPQAGMHEPMAPVASVRSVRDGESATLFGMKLTAIATPGHTPGAMSWSWESCEGEDCISIVYADSLSPVSRDDYRFSDHPEYVAAYRAGLDKIGRLDCDILLTPHPSASHMRDRILSSEGLRSAYDCKQYAASISARLDKRLAGESQ